MRYVSTRGEAPPLGFMDVTLAGLARDGGLYLPAEWPHFSKAEIARLKDLSYGELAFRIMRPFVGDAFEAKRRGVSLRAVAGTDVTHDGTPTRQPC